MEKAWLELDGFLQRVESFLITTQRGIGLTQVQVQDMMRLEIDGALVRLDGFAIASGLRIGDCQPIMLIKVVGSEIDGALESLSRFVCQVG